MWRNGSRAGFRIRSLRVQVSSSSLSIAFLFAFYLSCLVVLLCLRARIPQTNLFFFDLIAYGMIVCYLGGYLLFFKYVLPRIAMEYKLQQLLSLLVVTEGYSFFLESSLFIVLFTGLGLLIFNFVLIESPSPAVNFKIVSIDNPYFNDRQLLIAQSVNLALLTSVDRDYLFYQTESIDRLTLNLLNQVNLNQDQLFLPVYSWVDEVDLDELSTDFDLDEDQF